jgi:hypothetical protein
MRTLDDFLVDRVFEPVAAQAGSRWGANSHDLAAAMAGVSAWASLPVVTGLAAALLAIPKFRAIEGTACGLVLLTAAAEAHLAAWLAVSRRRSIRRADALRRAPLALPCLPRERVGLLSVRMALLALIACATPVVVRCVATVPHARPFALSVAFQALTVLSFEYFRACTPRPPRAARSGSLRATGIHNFLFPRGLRA